MNFLNTVSSFNRIYNKLIHKSSKLLFGWLGAIIGLLAFAFFALFFLLLGLLGFLFLSLGLLFGSLRLFWSHLCHSTLLDISDELGDVLNAEFFDFLWEKILVVTVCVDVNDWWSWLWINSQPLDEFSEVCFGLLGIPANKSAFLTIFFQRALKRNWQWRFNVNQSDDGCFSFKSFSEFVIDVRIEQIDQNWISLFVQPSWDSVKSEVSWVSSLGLLFQNNLGWGAFSDVIDWISGEKGWQKSEFSDFCGVIDDDWWGWNFSNRTC